MKVKVIPANRQIGKNPAAVSQPKLRVAAYCRVSTEAEEQESSYETQVAHYTEYISRNEKWKFAGIYADDGISGTSTKYRDEFNRMIEDAMDGKIDMILTKSISRFARNTLDCLNYIRQLKEKNIAVFFEKENINTLDEKGEVLITIMASLAQQESESLSRNVKLGLQFRYQRGLIQVNHNHFLGYTKDENGNLVIVSEEAKIVRRIFREFLLGKTVKQIGLGLEADGVCTGGGGERWYNGTILTILKNEKYMGDALLQKTYTVDPLSKKRVKNNGVMPQYYVEDSHPAIIPKKIFHEVQSLFVKRENLNTVGHRRFYRNKYPLSNCIFCGSCGEIYSRVKWTTRKHEEKIVWRCMNRLNYGPGRCSSETITNDELEEVVMEAIYRRFESRSDALVFLRENMRGLLTKDELDLRERIEDLTKKVEESNGDESLKAELLFLQEMEEAHQKEIGMEEEKETYVDSLPSGKAAGNAYRFDEYLVRRLLDRLTVYVDKFVVELKTGDVIEIVRK